MRSSATIRIFLTLMLLGTALFVALPGSAQEPPPANPVCANGGSIANGCLPPSRPPVRRQPTYKPPSPPNNSAAIHEAEIARAKAAAEAERVRKAAEDKRKQEDFQRRKAEALKGLTGVSSDDLALKSVGEDTSSLGLAGIDDSAGSLGLEGIDEAPNSSGLSETSRIYWRTVSVPAACVIAGQLKSSAGCSVLDALRLVNTLNQPNGTLEFERLVLAKAAEKTVVLSLGGAQDNLESKLDLVKTIYEAETKTFDEIYQRILNEMSEDPAKQEWMTEQAKLDSGAVDRLRRQIFAEWHTNVEASADYLQRNPNSGGVRFNCSHACQQLIQAARGTSVLQ